MASILSRSLISAMLISTLTPAVVSAAGPYAPLITGHRLAVSVDIKNRTVSGTDVITLKKSGDVRLLIRAGSSVDAVYADGKKTPVTAKDLSARGIREILLKLNPSGKPVTLEARFHGSFHDIGGAREKIKRGVAFVDDGVIGDEGVFLPSNSYWYPQEDGGLVSFDASVSVPEGYRTVMEGDLTEGSTAKDMRTERWRVDNPSEGIDLVAGRYTVDKETYKGVDIQTFFFERDDALSRLYIDKTKGYLDFYSGLIGPYPFKKFAVVESFLPTGYGMPSFTLLGSSVIRLPFIPDTSLGHEIAHNWWGNSAYVDDERGNWSEAITTFTADYLYAEKKGADDARAFRFSKLLGYKNFAEKSSLSLAGFRDATEPESRAVGYNKGSMVFLMLRQEIGTDAFEKGLKTFYKNSAFRRASWDGIKSAFESASGRELGWFFDQWIKRPGGPSITLAPPFLNWSTGGKYIVSFNVRQTNPARLTIPARFETASGTVAGEVKVSKELETVTIELGSLPRSLEIDPDFEVFRLLSDAEVPPSLSACFGDKDGVIVMPANGPAMEKYEPLARVISKDYGAPIATDADAGALKGKTLFVLGGSGENRAFGLVKDRLPKEAVLEQDRIDIAGAGYALKDGIFAIAVKAPEAASGVMCLFFGDAAQDKILAAGKRLHYFGESSYLVFNGGGGPVKGHFSSGNTLRHEF